MICIHKIELLLLVDVNHPLFHCSYILFSFFTQSCFPSSSGANSSYTWGTFTLWMWIRAPQCISYSFLSTLLFSYSYFLIVWSRDCLNAVYTLCNLIRLFLRQNSIVITFYFYSILKFNLWMKRRYFRVIILS